MQSLLDLCRRRANVVFLLAFVLAVAGAFLAARVSFDANVLRLLPRRSPTVRGFERFLQDFGSLEHLYIVFESTDDIDEHADLVNAYVGALRRAPEIATVDAQFFEPDRDWSYLSDRALYLLGGEGAAAALGRFERPGLDTELVHARDLLSFPSPRVKALVQQDPVGLFGLLRDRLSRERGGLSVDPTREGYVSADGRSRLLLVKPTGQPFDTDFCKALFTRLGAIESAARQTVSSSDSSSEAVRIEVAGAYRVSLESERLIRREGIANAVGSLALLLVVVLIVFRTPWILLFGLAPLSLAAILTLGLSGLVQGRISPATSGSAGMLFGLGIDGVVILYLRFLEEREAGRTADEATSNLAKTANSVVLAQATTAATFLALLVIDFPTLQDLGRLVGFGILICCGLTIALLPGLLSLAPSGAGGRSATSAWLGRLVPRARTPIVWAGLIATIVLGAASPRLRLDMSIERLQARTGGADVEREIAHRFALPTDVLLVLDEQQDLERLLETDDRLQHALAARMSALVASGIGTLLPPERAQTAVARAIGRSGLTVDRIRRNVDEAARGAGFRPGTFGPFLARVPGLVDPEARITYDGLVKHGLEPFVSRFLASRNGRHESVTYLFSHDDRARVDLGELSRLVHEVDPTLQVTGLAAIDEEVRRGFLPQFAMGIGIGTAGVALLVYLVFRSLRYTLLALVPTAVGFVWSAGLLSLAGVSLDSFSLFAAVTFIGIAVDYGIYVLYRYLREPPRDMGAVLTRTGAAILVAGSTALIGFGTLASSSYAPLRTFGIVSIVTLTSCLVATIFLLPALVLELERWSRSAR